MPNLGRDRYLDLFRGVVIIGMVFFTLILRFVENPPELLRHNVRNSFHFGDFILPLFLFSSGVSLAYSFAKMEGRGGGENGRRVNNRFLKLVLVGLVLSHWSTRGFGQMDEVMLSAICFLLLFLVRAVSVKWILILIATVTFLPLSLEWMGLHPNFNAAYLGGYFAIPWYFLVMLTGYVIGQSRVKGESWGVDTDGFVILLTLIMLASMLVWKPDKLSVSPSFILLSSVASLLLFAIGDYLFTASKNGLGCIKDAESNSGESLQKTKNENLFTLAFSILGHEVEYLGRNPLRFWVLMWALILIPSTELSEQLGDGPTPRFGLLVGFLLVLASVIVLTTASHLIDYALHKNEDERVIACENDSYL